MTSERSQFLAMLYQLGKTNDQQASRHDQRMLNITPETGPFLSLLIKVMQAATILEVGTSNGYSTIWLADAVEATGGHVTTIERSDWKVQIARENFEQAGVSARITQHLGHAETYLPTFRPNSFDFIFLDSDRQQYSTWWPLLLSLLKPGGLLVVDNAVSHAHELVTFSEQVHQTPGIKSLVVPIGNGELLIWKPAVERL